MTTMTSSRRVPAEGADHHGNKRVVVSFDPETFAQVRAHAVSHTLSFGAAVRELVEFGLLDIEAEGE